MCMSHHHANYTTAADQHTAMYWTVAVEGGPARVYHASVAVGKYIYTFGGRYCGKQTPEEKMEVHILDSETFQSGVLQVANENEDDIPPNLLAHTAVVHEGKIYIWGGYHSSPFNHEGPSELWRFDPSTRAWSRPATSGAVPTPRIHHASCVVGDCMYVIGGFERRFGFPMRVVHALHLPSLAWTVFPTSDACPKGGVYRSIALTHARGGTRPRDGCAQICLFGVATARTLVPTGGDQSGIELMVRKAMDQLYGWKVTFLDAATGEWLSAASPYLPTIPGSSGFVYGGHLYMTMSVVSSKQLGALTRRCIDDNALEQVLPLGAPRPARCLGSCVVVQDRVFFIGGATPEAENAHHFVNLNDKAPSKANPKYEKLKQHYGSLQVLDFRPDLQIMCIGLISKLDLDIRELPLTLKNDVELCSPKHRPKNEMRDNTDDISKYEYQLYQQQVSAMS